MNSREAILNAIRQNKPETDIRPETPVFSSSGDLVKQYQESLVFNGGASLVIEKLEEVNTYLKEQYSPDLKICSTLSEISGNVDLNDITDPHLLEDVHVAVLKGEWAVAENAAIWLSDKVLGQRVLPFITQHLIVVVSKSAIVGNMHEVYNKIDIRSAGYGVFIAGPSKTADIEQALVIGAHGARSLTVFISL